MLGACEHSTATNAILEKSADAWEQLYADAKKMDGDEITDLPMPRLAGRQRNQANVPTDSPFEYY